MVIKCKMCGGDLISLGDRRICECAYCGSLQTVPFGNDEKKINMYNRANYLRMNADFDQATVVYTSITAEYPQEAEAYWGLCLCKYGIEYVDDPLTKRKIPTCHRTLLTSILSDNDFIQACQHADIDVRDFYHSEADEINRLQQRIINIVKTEEPYDIFISYKETDYAGRSTRESFIAEKMYRKLTDAGYKVFFSKVSLRDKIGKEYEPYIFAALYSAKVMIVLGTKKEHLESEWVKNEWSRYLEFMRDDPSKVLIPCYRGMNVNELPESLRSLQCLDMDTNDYIGQLLQTVEDVVRPKNNTKSHQENRVEKSENKEILEELKSSEKERKTTARRNRFIIILTVIAIVLGIFLWLKATPRSQSKYEGMDYKKVVEELKEVGFWNVQSTAIEDIQADKTNLNDKVSKVEVSGNSDLSRFMFKWEKVEVFYHKLPDNAAIEAPVDSGEYYKNRMVQDVADLFSSIGFADIDQQPVSDLNSITDGNRGKVIKVTIAGDEKWTENNEKKTYYRNDKVTVYYHETKEDAQVSPPQGNSDNYCKDNKKYDKARKEFMEAGFTNITVQGNDKLTSNSYGENIVEKITIDGELDWSYGIGGMLRKTYARNVPVIITYYSVKDDE